MDIYNGQLYIVKRIHTTYSVIHKVEIVAIQLLRIGISPAVSSHFRVKKQLRMGISPGLSDIVKCPIGNKTDWSIIFVSSVLAYGKRKGPTNTRVCLIYRLVGYETDARLTLAGCH
jgi:Lhr-like helicase